MFGMFNGMFGDGFMAKATEMALEMCLLDEMEKEEQLDHNLHSPDYLNNLNCLDGSDDPIDLDNFDDPDDFGDPDNFDMD